MQLSFKIICRRYAPGTAWMNRYMGYAKALSHLGHKVTFIFLITNKEQHTVRTNDPLIDCIYLWMEDGFLCQHSKLLSYLKNKKRIKNYIHEGDICLMSDASGFYLDEIRNNFKNLILFESTEHPEILGRLFNRKIELILFFRKLRRVDYLLVISEALRQYYIAKGIPESKILVVNMFVDAERFIGLNKRSSRKYIAYCGSVSIQKDGVDVLLRSFAKFRQVHPDFYLDIYGTGPTDVVEKLKQLCIQCNIQEYVNFVGLVPYDLMPQKLYDASILALSRPDNLQNQYGFPTKLGEYLATGNPVVITSVGEIPTFIKDGLNGYLAVPGDVDSFSQKLIQAADDLKCGDSIVGKKGIELANSIFSSQTQIEKLLRKIK